MYLSPCTFLMVQSPLQNWCSMRVGTIWFISVMKAKWLSQRKDSDVCLGNACMNMQTEASMLRENLLSTVLSLLKTTSKPTLFSLPFIPHHWEENLVWDVKSKEDNKPASRVFSQHLPCQFIIQMPPKDILCLLLSTLKSSLIYLGGVYLMFSQVGKNSIMLGLRILLSRLTNYSWFLFPSIDLIYVTVFQFVVNSI